MKITLKPELAKFVEQQVQQGVYDSVDDVINAAVARLRAEDDLDGLPLEALRAELEVGIAEADRGEFVEYTAEDVIAERRAAWAARNSKAG